MTPKLLQEIIACRDSFEYFCKSCLLVDSANISPREFNNTNLTQSLAYILWKSLFEEHQMALIISPSLIRSKFAKEQLNILISRLSDVYKNSIVRNNSLGVEFASHSKIIFQSGKNAGRGFSVTTLCFDGSPSLELYQSIIPCICATKGTVL